MINSLEGVYVYTEFHWIGSQGHQRNRSALLCASVVCLCQYQPQIKVTSNSARPVRPRSVHYDRRAGLDCHDLHCWRLLLAWCSSSIRDGTRILGIKGLPWIIWSTKVGLLLHLPPFLPTIFELSRIPRYVQQKVNILPYEWNFLCWALN